MFEYFTEKSIKVIMLAQEETRRLGHNTVSTDMILLGIIAQGTSSAAKALKSYSMYLKDARKIVEEVRGRGSGYVGVEMPFSICAKAVLNEAMQLTKDGAEEFRGHDLEPHHLLLAMLAHICNNVHHEKINGREVLEKMMPELAKSDSLNGHITASILEILEKQSPKLSTSSYPADRIAKADRRAEVATILEMIAKDGLPGPRDLDVALDAIEQVFLHG